MPDTSTQVLNHQQVQDKITRIAWQIYEEFHAQEKVVIAGIARRGYLLAQLLKTELEKISALHIDLRELSLNKDEPLSEPVRLSPAGENFEDQNIVVVDDVLNSGATLIYGVRYFLGFDVRSMSTVVLVDRNHKRYPVKADFKGLSLSTSLKEHVSVNIEKQPFSVNVS